MLELYKNIKKRRIELNISQQELAEAVGYKGKSMISQVEKGLVDLPESMILKFADALDTRPSYLMGWEDDEPEVSYDPAQVEQAMKLFEKYQNAIPEIQTAVDSLLKSQSLDS